MKGAKPPYGDLRSKLRLSPQNASFYLTQSTKRLDCRCPQKNYGKSNFAPVAARIKKAKDSEKPTESFIDWGIGKIGKANRRKGRCPFFYSLPKRASASFCLGLSNCRSDGGFGLETRWRAYLRYVPIAAQDRNAVSTVISQAQRG